MPDSTVQDAIRAEAKKAGVPEAFALAVAEQESGFNPGARSKKGAIGVMQLMPDTAKRYGVNPEDPIQNIQGGVKHLRSLLDRYQGDPTKALTAYNAGEGMVGSDKLPKETEEYIPSVMARMLKFGPPPPKYGVRKDGTPKGEGFFGPLKRADGQVSTEISIGVNIDGKEVEIPTLVPTLTNQERQWLINNDVSDPKKIPPMIVQKATQYARNRIKNGQSPFAGDNEAHPPAKDPNETVRATEAGVLGASSKPSQLREPETWKEWSQRNYKALKKTMYDSIPSITGAVGGMIGGVAGAGGGGIAGSEVPVVGNIAGAGAGAYWGALAGAGSGAMIGKYIQGVIDHFTHEGPTLPTLAETAKISKEAVHEANTQVMYEAGGNLVAAPLGWVSRGGFLKYSRPAMETLRENAELGTRLSGPEIATGTRLGNVAKGVQTYASGAFVAADIQAGVRAQGQRAAEAQLDRALKILDSPVIAEAREAADAAERAKIGSTESVVEQAQREERAAYTGAERRSATGTGPGGVERRVARDEPITGDLSQRVRQLREEGFGLTGQQAAEMRGGAEAARREAAGGARPRGGGPVTPIDGQMGGGPTPPAEPPSSPRVAAGQAAEAGIGAAKTGLKATGKEMGAIIENAPPVPMQPIKDEAFNLFQQRVIPLLEAFPDVAGNPKVAQMIRELKDNPELIQRMPRPQMSLLADAILEKVNSPVVKMLRTMMGSEDQISFKAATQMRTLLRKAGAGEDALLSKKDAGSLAKRFEGLFTEHLFNLSPEYKAADLSYAEGARLLRAKQVETLFKMATTEPESVIGYLKTDAPTRARLLRRTLLTQAGKGPEGEKARAAFDTLRSTWFRETIIKGGKPGTPDLENMAGRLAQAEEGGVLGELFGDEKGRQVVANARRVANLMEKRSAETSGNLRKIFEISRMIGIGLGTIGAIGGGKLPTTGAVASAGAFEIGPDFFIWMIHDPRATKWFIQGVEAENPRIQSGAIIRLMELFRQQNEQAVTTGEKKRPLRGAEIR